MIEFVRTNTNSTVLGYYTAMCEKDNNVLRNDRTLKSYLVFIKLGGDTNRTRLASAAGAVKDVIDRITSAKGKLFFSSSDACSFGFFVKVKLSASAVRASLQGETRMVNTSALSSDDSVLVVELGEDWAAYGFSNSWHWLQNE